MGTFATLLSEVRTEEKLTQKQVADIIGVSRTCYASWEQGTRQPNIEKLHALCKTLHVSADYLLGLENYDGTKNY